MKLKAEISKSKNNIPSKKKIQNIFFEELDSLVNNFGKSPLSISKDNFQSTEKKYDDETINNYGKKYNLHYQKEDSKSHIINNRRVFINNNTNNTIKEDSTITFKDNSIKNEINSQIKNKFDIDLIQINNENLNKNENLNTNFKENILKKNNNEFTSAINLNQINNQKKANFTLNNNIKNQNIINKNINNGIVNSLNKISMTININNNISSSNKKSKESFSLSSIDLDSYFENLESIKKIQQNPSKKYLQTKKNYLENFPLNLIIKYPNLNKVQESCFDLLFYTNENSLITAPTGSGKTLLFEISLARIIKENFNFTKNTFNKKNFKIIYIAPIKSLCQEKSFDWKIKFSQNPLNLNILEFTSDNEYINFTQLNEANLILTTPEKLF